MGGSGWREHEPALFVIVSMRPGREIAVPTASARAAQQTARYLLEHYSHIRPTWQVNPDAPFGPVVVFGCRRPLAGKHLLEPAGARVHADRRHPTARSVGGAVRPSHRGYGVRGPRPRDGATVPGVPPALDRRPRTG
jgi:hypothetical protein